MSPHLFWPLFFLAAIGGAVVLGLIHEGIERVIARHRRQFDEYRPFIQPTHVRRVPDPQQEKAS